MCGQLRWLIAALIGLMACGAGCVGPWRPSLAQVEPKAPAQGLDFAAYLKVDRLGRWVYERRELPAGDDHPASLYVRRITGERMSEGRLEKAPFLPLERYLDLEPAGSPRTRPSAGGRPRAPLKGGTAVFFALADPVEAVPLDLETTGPIRSETPIRYFDYRGKLAAEGTLTRRVQIEGFEDADCPAGRFERCLRLRVDLNVVFPWVAIVNLTSYLWLSPEVGEVRRVQRLSGWFLIFWFGSAHEYDLVSHEKAGFAGDPSAPPPKWGRGVLLLEGDFPGPRIAGMIVDFGGPGLDP